MTTTTPPATAVAAEVLAHLETAWNDGDGRAFGGPYAPDASFVTIRGEHIVGSDSIGAGHAGIFASIYAGSVNRMRLVHVGRSPEGVLVAVSANTLNCPGGPLAGEHTALSTSVLSPRTDGAWQILATHNTLVAV